MRGEKKSVNEDKKMSFINRWASNVFMPYLDISSTFLFTYKCLAIRRMNEHSYPPNLTQFFEHFELPRGLF